MSDAFYRTVRFLGSPVVWINSKPVVIGADRVPTTGRCLIAATHQSPYDVPLLMRHTPRLLDFVSIVEVFRNPLVAWFYRSLNAFPLDRSRPDVKTVRIIVDRLKRSRAVVIFPEGGIRKGADSVVHTRRIRPGCGRIARLTGAAITPCVVINSQVYSRSVSWLPLRRTRYGLIYGTPIDPALGPDVLEAKLIDAFVSLHAELSKAMGDPPSGYHSPGRAPNQNRHEQEQRAHTRSDNADGRHEPQ
ncbi:MAG: 1-acyl-sn-glycerol-3-phosphate acyltransferase [Phycisphaerales bacterium]|nr:1-acyl-sn-glycerol-3-phosphate acyltransferase [Phycisphaerales bacterium]